MLRLIFIISENLWLLQEGPLLHALLDLAQVVLGEELSGHDRGKIKIFFLTHLFQVHEPGRLIGLELGGWLRLGLMKAGDLAATCTCLLLLLLEILVLLALLCD